MKNIFLIGMPGSGKTTVGKALAEKLGLGFLDCDQYIEKSQGLSIPQIFDKYGEPHFRNLETEALKELVSKGTMVISTGGGVVERAENVDLLRKSGTVIFINRPLEHLLKDTDPTHRPLLKDGKDKLIELFEKRFLLYKNACHLEVLNDTTPENTVLKIIKEVTKND